MIKTARSCIFGLILLSLTSVAFAQTRGNPTPTPTLSASTQHQFNRGESIYEPPNERRIRAIAKIKNDPVALNELAFLLAQYDALGDINDPEVQVRRASDIRRLGIAKAKWYGEKGIAPLILEVKDVDAYTTFWKNFWIRADATMAVSPGATSDGKPNALLPLEEAKKILATQAAKGGKRKKGSASEPNSDLEAGCTQVLPIPDPKGEQYSIGLRVCITADRFNRVTTHWQYVGCWDYQGKDPNDPHSEPIRYGAPFISAQEWTSFCIHPDTNTRVMRREYRCTYDYAESPAPCGEHILESCTEIHGSLCSKVERESKIWESPEYRKGVPVPEPQWPDIDAAGKIRN